MTTAEQLRLVGIAWRLDRLRWMPHAVLRDIVTRAGACMAVYPDDAPEWLDAPQTDRELAELICAGCPVIDECLELELRTAGEDTVGVWGALPEHDRREVHWHWRQRGERAAELGHDESTGGESW